MTDNLRPALDARNDTTLDKPASIRRSVQE
jgi:hypothetical protein